MIAETVALDKAARHFVALSDAICFDEAHSSYTFFEDEATRELMVSEGTAANGDFREFTATEWFGELALLADKPTSVYDITYLKIAVKRELKGLQGAKFDG